MDFNKSLNFKLMGNFANEHKNEHLWDSQRLFANYEGIIKWDEQDQFFKFRVADTTKILATTEDITNLYDVVEKSLAFKQDTYIIGLGDNPNADFLLPDSEDMAAANVEIANAIPAYAQVLSIALRCTEDASAAEGALTSFVAKLGTLEGDDSISVSQSIIASNEYLNNTLDPFSEFGILDTPRSIFISDITPDANWADLITGEWKLFISYIKNE